MYGGEREKPRAREMRKEIKGGSGRDGGGPKRAQDRETGDRWAIAIARGHEPIAEPENEGKPGNSHSRHFLRVRSGRWWSAMPATPAINVRIAMEAPQLRCTLAQALFSWETAFRFSDFTNFCDAADPRRVDARFLFVPTDSRRRNSATIGTVWAIVLVAYCQGVSLIEKRGST